MRSFLRRLRVGILLALLIPPALPCVAAPDEPSKELYLVITREMFVDAAQPLIEKRREEGFEVVISLKHPSEALHTLKRQPDLVLLIGDCQPGQEERSWFVPAKRMKRYRQREWQERHWPVFFSDSAWGDLDGDLMPDIPVGRLPVRTAAQLEQLVGKILEYERQPPSLNDLRLPIATGDPEPSADRDGVLWATLGNLATPILLGAVSADAPRWVQPWLLSADPKHPLRGWAPDQPDLFSEQLQQGGFFARLDGHGSRGAFYFLRFEGEYIRYTAETASEGLATGKPGSPLVIGACNSGNFAGADDCLAESLLRMPGGPVAVIAATTVDNSIPHYLSGRAFLQISSEGKIRRLGEFWTQMLRRFSKVRNPIVEKLLMDSEGYGGGKADIRKLWRDHMLMSAMLGDPAMRLRIPQRLHGKLRREGDGWSWQVHKPSDATRLHVDFRPARQSWPRVPANATKQQLRGLLRAANETFAFQELLAPPADGPWEGVIDREGTLRLVAFAPDTLYVAALDLKLPSENPAESAKAGKPAK